MASEPADPATLDRPWRRWATIAVVAVLCVGALFAFVILPNFQRENAQLDLWTAMCRSLGVTSGSPAYRQPVSTARAVPVSQVQWGPDVLRVLAEAEPERGARIVAETCVPCHGERGVSATPDLPSLNGQEAAAIYKQLYDYRTGARVHPQMTEIARQLQPIDLANVAAYFGADAQPGAGLGSRDQPGGLAIVRLAREGDSARRIPACNSCHVNGSGGPIETPILTGQDHLYLAAQLRAFKTGQRKNDVYRRMRAIAAQLDDREIEGLSRYYEGVL
jgi:cytochrome c553